MNPVRHVAAIVVTYLPQVERLVALLDALSLQCDLIVVANSPVDKKLQIAIRSYPETTLIENDNNIGLSAAQNFGIQYARSRGVKYLFFFDQDSLPSANHVDILIKGYESLTLLGYRVGVIGPLLLDTNAKTYLPFYSPDWFRIKEIREPRIGQFAPASYILSSGSLISMSVLNAVGDFNKSLFIDYIDLEWGFRASSMGYQNFGCFNLVMQHTIGDRSVRLFGKIHPLHSPKRHYFMFRNSILLMKLKHVPVQWKANEVLRIIPRLLVYSFFSKKPFLHLYAGISGILDGLLGHNEG